jgi:hypothetical protein
MEAVNSNPGRVLAAIALLVFTGWVWALSNVSMPDGVWMVNAGLTVVLLVLLVVVGVRRLVRG